jgi:hypothetical protein
VVVALVLTASATSVVCCSPTHSPVASAGDRLAAHIELARSRTIHIGVEHRITQRDAGAGWRLEAGDRPFLSTVWRAAPEGTDLEAEYGEVALLQWPGDIRFQPDGHVISLGPVVLGARHGADRVEVAVSRMGEITIVRLGERPTT